MRLAVIICTHNPHYAFLERTLNALRLQDFPLNKWTLTVVDNASSDPVSSKIDLGWHPNSKVIREDRLGLTNARLRGLSEVKGDVYVLVDDDNLLKDDYLSNVDRIATLYPHLGAFGGSVSGEFQSRVPKWATNHLQMLALRNPRRAEWSNSLRPNESTPIGAGLVIRECVAETWTEATKGDNRRLALGRIGAALSSDEDIDIALTACDLGLGMGVFPELHLTHIIPENRLRLDYFVRLAEAIAESHIILNSLRNSSASETSQGIIHKLLWHYHLIRLPPEERQIQKAIARGSKRGRAKVRRLESASSFPD